MYIFFLWTRLARYGEFFFTTSYFNFTNFTETCTTIGRKCGFSKFTNIICTGMDDKHHLLLLLEFLKINLIILLKKKLYVIVYIYFIYIFYNINIYIYTIHNTKPSTKPNAQSLLDVSYLARINLESTLFGNNKL